MLAPKHRHIRGACVGGRREQFTPFEQNDRARETMAQETYDWSTDYSDEQSGTTTTFTSSTLETVDVTVSQPDPNGWYRTNRDGFETNSTMGGDNTGYFEMGVNYPNASSTVTTTISFANNTESGADSVTDVSFTLYDIDSTSSASFQDQVTVLAFDVDGNPLTVTLTAVNSSVVTISGATATAVPGAGSGPSGSVAASSTEGNVNVSISGEVASIQIVYGNGPSVQANPANQAIGFGDLSFDLVPPVVCFARGTRIRTMNGETPIEELRVGDLVVTADSGLQPLRWIGHRQVAAHSQLAPIRFEAGAIGNMRPLALSPKHRVLLSGWKAELLFGELEVLATAAHLVNGTSIVQAKQDVIEYFHIMFDAHQVVFAEGAPCESLFASDLSIGAVGSGAQGEIEAILGGAQQDYQMFGETARLCLKRHEAGLMH